MDSASVQILNRKRAIVYAYLRTLTTFHKQSRSRKRVWSRSWLLRRDQENCVLSMLFNELGPEDPSSFANYTRMKEPVWNELLALVEPLIVKQNTVMREAISPKRRLSVTIRYLATGNTFKDLSYSTRMAPNTISKVVQETLEAIIIVLQSRAITFPASAEDWKVIAQKFEMSWNFPHCVGALDGKHINFRPARKEGSKYRNYKGSDSIILLALVDAEYKFLLVDVGRNGRTHDSTVFRTSVLGMKMENKGLNLPSSIELPNANYKLPYVIVGDDAFCLKENLLKPYPDRGLMYEKKIFNYRLSRARRVVENAFGILANRWRILLTTIPLDVKRVETITYACILLHNYILSKKSACHWYVPSNSHESNFQTNVTEMKVSTNPSESSNRSSDDALQIRDKFCYYFNNEGTVPFQHSAVTKGHR
ncbi:protein ALP1-like [Ctenocephalides felis]|uniref:protein ALP1-like n=1 Tax=Ctenocephalides felis TaxID=7515 RepID=UPI000E6E53C7|nr:protein ALP1-like [Ctenocephalides felis]